MKKFLLGAVLAGAMTSFTTANAAEITYTLQGTFSIHYTDASNKDFDFDNVNITFTGIGDTTGVFEDGPGVPSNQLTSLVANVEGVGVITLPSTYTFFDNNNSGIVGVYDDTFTDIFDIQNDAFLTYDAASNLGPIPVVYPDLLPGGNVACNGGVAFIEGASDMTFSAIVAGTPPIGGLPEPGTWTMMLVGFLGLGTIVRRRNFASGVI